MSTCAEASVPSVVEAFEGVPEFGFCFYGGAVVCKVGDEVGVELAGLRAGRVGVGG